MTPSSPKGTRPLYPTSGLTSEAAISHEEPDGFGVLDTFHSYITEHAVIQTYDYVYDIHRVDAAKARYSKLSIRLALNISPPMTPKIPKGNLNHYKSRGSLTSEAFSGSGMCHTHHDQTTYPAVVQTRRNPKSVFQTDYLAHTSYSVRAEQAKAIS